MNDQLIITPKTKVLQAIEAYPQLEDILISYVPAFEKLKNPVLRRTVAKIATLQQAAAIGNVKVEDLINRLRAEIGQDLFTQNDSHMYVTETPAWYSESLIAAELDARPMLAAGEHPVNQVMEDLKVLDNGKIYKLTAPFLPAPLIDKASSMNYAHWMKKEDDGSYTIYFIATQN
ncbi:hypothetical protein SDC9_35062 [bioreactor metagenome]|jgi:uncharacterized protein (DUF2249 family)|uniref:DUF1858 domain-containing protein n=1 Tax=bioreactor metagenome TaxID=1076179 RepID=A0A644VCN8_9ZZZZ|nr:DUF1858 domain-containing protein [Lentimicrobium sp.]MEA5111574.1 DUF1858 domain-containing protein [Lentimicrobium sp.]HCT70486.1 hypothetical protein [Bacteroidales bacterium]